MDNAAKVNYKFTKLSCYLGYFVQAIVINMIAVLFVPIKNLYGLSYGALGLLVFINFLTQLIIDLALCRLPDKYGFRVFLLMSALCTALGLALFGLAPFLFHSNVMAGFIVATVVFSAGGGLLELILSPLINAIPSDAKAGSMSFLHSFYAWGTVLTILFTTLFINILPNEMWFFIPFFWTAVPLLCFVMWFKVPVPKTLRDESHPANKRLHLNPIFILFVIAIAMGGASETTVSQWASAFVQNGLGLDKLTGDILGPCLFAVMLGIGRVVYGVYGKKLNLSKVIISSLFLTIACYAGITLSLNPVISVIFILVSGIATCLLWPGTLVLASERFPYAGAWLFAILAAGGDIGAAVAPLVTGYVTDFVNVPAFASVAAGLGITTEQLALRAGLAAGVIFPLITLIIYFIIIKKNKKNS